MRLTLAHGAAGLALLTMLAAGCAAGTSATHPGGQFTGAGHATVGRGPPGRDPPGQPGRYRAGR